MSFAIEKMFNYDTEFLSDKSWSTKTKSLTLSTLLIQQVIKGWDQGLLNMCVGKFPLLELMI